MNKLYPVPAKRIGETVVKFCISFVNTFKLKQGAFNLSGLLFKRIKKRAKRIKLRQPFIVISFALHIENQ